MSGKLKWNSGKSIQLKIFGTLTMISVLVCISEYARAEGDGDTVTPQDKSETSTATSAEAPTEEPSARVSAKITSDEGPQGNIPPAGTVTVPVEVGGQKKKGPKEPYRRSKLTKDVSEGKADRRRVILATGEDKVVDLDFDVEQGPQGIYTGNNQVVGTTLVTAGDEKRQIVFKPLKAGETTVTIRDPDGKIRIIFDVIVSGSNLLRRAAEIRDLLKDIEGIEIKLVGQNIIIDGEVIVPNDYGRIIQVIGQKPYSDFTTSLVTLSPISMLNIAKRIEKDVQGFAPNVTSRVVNGKIFLEGTVDDAFHASRAVQIAKIYLPDASPQSSLQQSGAPIIQLAGQKQFIYNFIVVNPPPQKKLEKLVKLTVHFVDLAKDYARSFGFNWSPGFTSDPQVSFGQNNQAGGGGLSFSGTIGSLIPKLQTAQSAGYGRVIKQTTIITRSGIQGAVVEETQFPVVVTSANGTVQASSVPVTFQVKATPTILGQSEDLQVQIDFQQQSVVGRAPAGGSPITSKKAMNTVVYLKSNESAALAGFDSNEVSTGFNKDPLGSGSFEGGDGQTQTLFELKRTKSFNRKRGQFVVFVTPQIIENASEGSEDLKKNFRIKAR